MKVNYLALSPVTTNKQGIMSRAGIIMVKIVSKYVSSL